MPREEFEREVEKEITGQETKPFELMYFKLYQSQVPVVDRAIETAALMLGSDKSRGYCLEMICTDFLARANLESDDPGVLLQSALRFFQFLPGEEKKSVVGLRSREGGIKCVRPKQPRLPVGAESYEQRRNRCFVAMAGDAKRAVLYVELGGPPENFAASRPFVLPATPRCITVDAFR